MCRMNPFKPTATHWIIFVCVVLGTLAPHVAQLWPTTIPVCNTIVQLDPVILGLLGASSTSMIPALNEAVVAKAKALAAKAATALLALIIICAMSPWLVACHETPQAAVAQAIALTDTVCALAPDSPIGQPDVDVVCTFTEAGEQLVSVIVNSSSNGSAVMSSTVRIPLKSIRFSIPAASKDVFLAAYGQHIIPLVVAPPAASVAPAPAMKK